MRKLRQQYDYATQVTCAQVIGLTKVPSLQPGLRRLVCSEGADSILLHGVEDVVHECGDIHPALIYTLYEGMFQQFVVLWTLRFFLYKARTNKKLKPF